MLPSAWSKVPVHLRVPNLRYGAHAACRFDPVRNAEKLPVHSAAHISGKREKVVIAKENNFQQVRASCITGL